MQIDVDLIGLSDRTLFDLQSDFFMLSCVGVDKKTYMSRLHEVQQEIIRRAKLPRLDDVGPLQCSTCGRVLS